MKRMCAECGGLDFSVYYDDVTVARMMHLMLCFECLFWTDLVEGLNDTKVIVKGEHYTISPERGSGRWAGFGGRPFRIAFNDGRIVETRNLWCQGKIPTLFQARLKDNARFLDARKELVTA